MSLDFFEQQVYSFEKELEMHRQNRLESAQVWYSLTVEEKYMEKMDDLLLYTYHFLQGLSTQKKRRDRIIQTGKIFLDDIQTIANMKKLNLAQITWIAENECKSILKNSILRGGLTGSIHPIFGSMNIPVEIALYLKTIQTIGLTFGHEMNNPFEMMLALNILNGSLIPRPYQFDEWIDLKSKLIDQDLLKLAQEKVLTGKGTIIQPLYQLLTVLMLRIFRKKKVKKLPILSVGIGALSHYYHVKKVIDFTLKFYQYRYIYEKRLLKE